jgi:hypothetical protein
MPEAIPILHPPPQVAKAIETIQRSPKLQQLCEQERKRRRHQLICPTWRRPTCLVAFISRAKRKFAQTFATGLRPQGDRFGTPS